jgi:hypothetical protein
MSSFKSRFPLEGKSVAAGGNAIFDLTQLPDDGRLQGIMLELICTSTAASGTATIYPSDIIQALALVDLDSEFFFLRATGRMLHVLYRHMEGMALGGNTGVVQGTGGVSMRAHCWIPIIDRRALNPNDTAIPARLLNNKTLNVTFASSLALTISNVVYTLSAATLRAVAHMAPSSGDMLPVKSKIAFEDWSALQANLAPGVFSHLGVYDESDLSLTPEQYAQFSLSADGQTILDRQLANQCVADYNLNVPRDAASCLACQPTVACEFMPLITPRLGYKLPQLIRAKRGFRVDIDSGTATGGRYYYRQVLPITDSEEKSAIAKLGLNPETTIPEVKTASKNEPSGSVSRQHRHARLLPKRLHRA